jgi:hypothetical protein
MKKIRYILILIIVLLFTGCSGNYNLTFNKDLSLTEELNVNIDNKENTYETTYSLFEKAGIDPDKYEILIVEDKVRIKYKEKYSSFEKYYLDSKLYKMLFENIEYKKDNKGMVINTKSILKLDDNDNQNIINSYDISDFKININTPFSVNDSNADSIKDNTYTWILNSKDTYKDISIDFSYQQDNVYGLIIVIALLSPFVPVEQSIPTKYGVFRFNIL